MPRLSTKYGITEEDKAIAEQNGIPTSTLYARLRTGWEKERAITEKPKRASELPRDHNGELFSQDPKGKGRGFQLPARLDAEIDRAIAESGLSASEWFVEAAIAKLEIAKLEATNQPQIAKASKPREKKSPNSSARG